MGVDHFQRVRFWFLQYIRSSFVRIILDDTAYTWVLDRIRPSLTSRKRGDGGLKIDQSEELDLIFMYMIQVTPEIPVCGKPVILQQATFPLSQSDDSKTKWIKNRVEGFPIN